MAAPRRDLLVTGLGFVAPGISGGRDQAAALRARLLAAAEGPQVGEERTTAGFDAAGVLGERGLRHLGRGTLCLMGAALLALRDAGLAGDALEQAGVAAGTATAAAAVVADFDRTTLAEGPQAPNPALFPQTVWNGPASQVSIRHGLRGPNLTISSGLNSGLDAVIAACRILDLGGARALLACGFEELSPYLRVIVPGGGLERAPVPLCEGAAVLVLEEGGAAAARGARPLATLSGWGSDFSPDGSATAAAAAARPPEGTHRVWRHQVTDGAAAPQSGTGEVPVVGRFGCGGGFTGALAALLAAAPGERPDGSGKATREIVAAADDRGRNSVLLVERRG